MAQLRLLIEDLLHCDERNTALKHKKTGDLAGKVTTNAAIMPDFCAYANIGRKRCIGQFGSLADGVRRDYQPCRLPGTIASRGERLRVEGMTTQRANRTMGKQRAANGRDESVQAARGSTVADLIQRLTAEIVERRL